MQTHPFLRRGYAVVDVENSGLLDGLNPSNPAEGPNAIVVGTFSPEGEMTAFTGCVAEEGVVYATSEACPAAAWYRTNVLPNLGGLEPAGKRWWPIV